MRIPSAVLAAALSLLAAPAFAHPGERDCTLVAKGFGPKGKVAVHAEVVVSGLTVPWGIGFLPSGHWLVTERPGRIRLVRDGKLERRPVARIDVGSSTEGGLLGIAVDPDFAKSRAFFVYVTVSKKGRAVNQLQRWRLAEDERSAKLERVLLDDLPAARYHDGGRVRFGPDGLLYVSTGDARGPENAQDPSSLAGKVLRIRKDGTIPQANPFPKSPVFLLGLRNVEGFGWWDPKTLVIADHGPTGELHGRTGHDEINVGHPAENFGWPTIYGCEEDPGMIRPVLTWNEAVPPGGLAIDRSNVVPGWKGSVLVGTLGSKHLHRVVLDPKDPRRIIAHEVYFEGDPPHGFGRLRDVEIGPGGQIYVTTSNCDGRGKCGPKRDEILRILPGAR